MAEINPWEIGSWNMILEENLKQRITEMNFSERAVTLYSAICHCNLIVLGHLLDDPDYDWNVSDAFFTSDLKESLQRIHFRIEMEDEIAIIVYGRIANTFNI